jgi:mRNA-degrading endonuclease RelE of RelBE toxin-antitoxin system
MEIERTRQFRTAYRKLSRQDRERADEALLEFAQNPLHPSLHVEKIQGTADKWSFRVSRRLRITFSFRGGDLRNASLISLSNVGGHEVYKRPR